MALQNQHTLIAPEGRLLIVFTVVAAGIATYHFGFVYAGASWLVPLFLAYMFRDPTRKVPSEPLAVVSPVDGQILSIDKCRDGYIDRDAVKIVLSMGPLDVYSVRSPIEGKVIHQWYVDEQVVVSDAPVFAQWIQTDENDDILLAMFKGRFWRRPRNYIQFGERIGQGQRCGFMSLGAVVEVYVPDTARIEVEVGQRVTAGETVMAHFIHRG